MVCEISRIHCPSWLDCNACYSCYSVEPWNLQGSSHIQSMALAGGKFYYYKTLGWIEFDSLSRSPYICVPFILSRPAAFYWYMFSILYRTLTRLPFPRISCHLEAARDNVLGQSTANWSCRLFFISWSPSTALLRSREATYLALLSFHSVMASILSLQPEHRWRGFLLPVLSHQFISKKNKRIWSFKSLQQWSDWVAGWFQENKYCNRYNSNL